jgi:U32 family peptidase
VTDKIPHDRPELLLPAGGFDSAIAAIQGGADALYLGFADFSARRQARNFDRLEYRRLYRYAREKGVKLYATLNTVILQEELGALSSLLAFLGRFPPDAVLVQDWGLARLIKERHPDIAIHASTQTAVQGPEAVRIARELGASRVVLPRETSLAEMRRLREEEPDMEYEAFVHGALCYSFSGLCLASGLVLGRSGNRGECAQLCRSFYDAASGATSRGGLPGKRGYWFSCRDLDLSGRVADLAEAGICSLKVEGRMKSPEYCFAVARLYRGRIDALSSEGPDEVEMRARIEAARVAFSRSPSEGWLLERGGSRIVDSAYPGHRGVRAGRIVKAAGTRIVLDLESPLGLHDGLLGFESSPTSSPLGELVGADESRPVRFPALGLRDARSGREIVKAEAGARVEIEVRIEDGRAPEFVAGGELRRISARELDRRSPSPEEYEAAKEELELCLNISAEGLGAELALPSFGSRGAVVSAKIEASGTIPIDAAKKPGGFLRALSLFAESGDADFLLMPRLEKGRLIELNADPATGAPRGYAPEDIFVPPSVLKREKNRVYACASALVAEAEAAYAKGSLAFSERCGEGAAAFSRKSSLVPPRRELVFPREGLNTGMPFAMPRDLAGEGKLPSWGGRSWLPLAPLVYDRRAYADLVRGKAKEKLSEGNALVLGLGALHHVALCREIVDENEDAGERLSFFLDINLYVANDSAWTALSSLLPRVEFAYRYIEAMKYGPMGTGTRPWLAEIGEGFEAPLFQSFGCLLKHHACGGSCPENCGRAWSATLADRDRRYRAIVEDCISMLFRTEG